MRSGQILQFVITDYYRKNSRKRSIPVELITDKTSYDKRRYVELSQGYAIQSQLQSVTVYSYNAGGNSLSHMG